MYYIYSKGSSGDFKKAIAVALTLALALVPFVTSLATVDYSAAIFAELLTIVDYSATFCRVSKISEVD